MPPNDLLAMRDIADALLESADGIHQGRVTDIRLGDSDDGLVVLDLVHGPEATLRRILPLAARPVGRLLRGRHERSVPINEVRTFGTTLMLRQEESAYDLADGDVWAARILRLIPGSGAPRPTPARRSRGLKHSSSQRTTWLADLVGTPVRDYDGRELGRVTEIRVTPRSHRVTALLVGTHGWLMRLGIQGLVQRLGWSGPNAEVEWSRVGEWSAHEVRLRPLASPGSRQSGSR